MDRELTGAERAETMRCPYCGRGVGFVDSATVYNGKSYGMIYLCQGWPKCTARVGCHPGTDIPLGTLADNETRQARRAAHAMFDRIWQEGHMSRQDAYCELAAYFGGSKSVHIGESDVSRCKQIIQFARLYLDVE